MNTIRHGLMVTTLVTLVFFLTSCTCIWIGNISPALIVLTLAWVIAGFFLSRKSMRPFHTV